MPKPSEEKSQSQDQGPGRPVTLEDIKVQLDRMEARQIKVQGEVEESAEQIKPRGSFASGMKQKEEEKD
jgi:hypothetical protein